ncbi:MAG: metal ABC transporter permease [Fusobacteria bacterium]|nr:metal ABC transporter permease [Fusobacteriota bacterium]
MLELFSYQFMQNAFIGSILVSILCGIIGSYIVVTRKVLISGSISHASFGGIGIAFLLNMPPLLCASIFSVIVAVLIQWMSKHLKMREDSAIGMIWACGMAIGVIAIYLAPGYAKDLGSYLFGNILTLSSSDLFFSASIMILLIIFFTLFYKTILYGAFDSEYMKTRGVSTKIIDYLLMVLLALTIIASLRLIGIILIVAMLTIPQECASIFVKKLKFMIYYSIVISLIASILGLIISFYLNVPSGPIIILLLILFYSILKGLFLLKIQIKKRT